MIGKIIYLAPEDDLAGVRDRIEWAQAQRIALVLPDNHGTSSIRELDFALIRRAGQQCGSEIAIVTRNESLRRAAHETGLITFGSVKQAVRHRWLTNEDVSPLERLTPPRRFVPNTMRRFYPRRNWFMIGLKIMVALATFAIVSGAALVVVPTAQVTLTASSQDINLIVPVTLDTQVDKVDVENLAVPAQRVDVVVEDVVSVPTTGAKDIPQGKATGTVLFFNMLATPYKVPKNTVVRTSSASIAIRFVTLSDVDVPPAGRAEVAVQAIDEGPSGNVPANQINRVEGLPSIAVNVLNAAETKGGGVKTVHAVTQDDYTRARALAQEKLLQTALQKMQADPEVMRNGWYIVPNTLFIADVQDETYNRFVTEQADELSLSLRLQVAGLAVSPADLDSIARAKVASKVPLGFSLLDVTTERGDVAEEGTGVRTEFFITAHARAGAAIDVNQVKKLVRGKTIADAQSALLENYSLTGNPAIVVQPDWLLRYTNRMPFVTLRIEAQVKRQ
ncbi:MAG: baseplate J/gp47 family protein [Chloroflexi bacterium]|nr:baseplate J/gp47 family protein [Chloroflexota bacterium]MCL5273687.1 baseplate J/gp47 family protein [Chloroflexota bacterium]